MILTAPHVRKQLAARYKWLARDGSNRASASARLIVRKFGPRTSYGQKIYDCDCDCNVGFIDWLDVGRDFIGAYRCRQKRQQKLSRH